MTLERYWRPQNDTGYGFCYYPDTEHYSPYDIKHWVPELKKTGASWLVLLSTLETSIPEFFVKKLVDNEIEPVVRVTTPDIRPLETSTLAALLRTYAEWGVHYVEVFSEANESSRWPVEEWCKPALVERFVEMLVPCLEEMQAAGLHPVFPALRPAGDYWDLSFLGTALALLATRVDASLLQNMVIGMHNHAFDKPLSWGEGGQKRWTGARPYFRPDDSQDHLGHRLFEWYDEIAQSTLGYSLGLLGLGSTAVGDPCSTETGVWEDEEAHAERAQTIATMQMEGTTPDYVVCHTFWLLTAKEGDPNRTHAWYGAQGGESQAVTVLRGLLKHTRQGKDTWPRPDPPTPSPDEASGVEFVGLSQEMVERLSIRAAPRSDVPYWKVVRVEVQPDTQNMSAYSITDAESVRFFRADGEYSASPKDDPYAPEGARLNAASMPMFAGWGAYSVEVVGNSEVLGGFGLYGDNLELTQTQHHPVLVTFELVSPGGKDPQPVHPAPPSPPPDPAPPSPPSPAPDPAPSPPAGYRGFSRPPGDNGMGIHFGLNTTTEAIALDIRRAKDMRLTWATLCYQGEEQLLRCARMIWEAGLMPVCRHVTSIDRKYPFGRDAHLLIDNGIPAYIQIFNEPSDDREWKNGRPRGYIGKWSELWAEKATDVYNSGGYPGLQCLSLEEAEAAIEALGAGSPVWQRVWFCSHNYGLNHPPDWQENEWCVLGFEFFAELFQSRLGFVPPIICGEGGWLYGASDDPRYPRVDGETHAKYTKAMFRWFRKGRLSNGESLPHYLFAACPWILSGPSDEAWYGYTTKALTIWAVKSIKEFVRLPPD